MKQVSFICGFLLLLASLPGLAKFEDLKLSPPPPISKEAFKEATEWKPERQEDTKEQALLPELQSGRVRLARCS